MHKTAELAGVAERCTCKKKKETPNVAHDQDDDSTWTMRWVVNANHDERIMAKKRRAHPHCHGGINPHHSMNAHDPRQDVVLHCLALPPHHHRDHCFVALVA
jgi:hypothetical protein